jgi:hypothetical protein
METHLDKKTLDKLKQLKQNKVVNGSLIKKGSHAKDTRVSE